MEKAKLTKAQGIGLFVVITLVAIYVVINFLKGEDLFNKRTRYYTVFENVEGLSSTGPVYIRGLKVGTVDNIKYDNTRDYFVVKLSVKSDYAIPINSVVEVYSADLLGGKSVRINLGNANTHAKGNDTLKSDSVPDMISMLTSEIGPMKEHLSKLMFNLNATLDNINSILDSNTQKNISQSLTSLNQTLKNTEKITGNINSRSPEINSIIENLNTLSASLNAGSSDLNASLRNINKITEGLSEAELQATIISIRNLTQKLQDPNGTIGKLLSTDSLHNSVDSLVRSLNTFVEKMTENPKKFIKISVF